MKKFLTLLTGLFLYSLSYGQVGINTDDPQGVLHIKNTTKKMGFVLPILDNANNTVTPSNASAIEGTFVYDQGSQCVRIKTGSGWSGCLLDQANVSVTALGSTYWVASPFSTTTASIMQKKFSGVNNSTVFANGADKSYATGAGYSIYGLGIPGAAVTVTSAKRVSQNSLLTVSGSYDSHIFITTDGKIFVTGYNHNGKLGTGNAGTLTYDSWVQVTLAGASAGETPIQVQTTANASIILTNLGNVYSAGENGNGLTGQGTALGSTASFTKISGLSNIKSIWGGADIETNTMFTAIDNTNRIYAWGSYFNAGPPQLGFNGPKLSPIEITPYFSLATAGGATVTKVMVGYQGTIALMSDGTLWAGQTSGSSQSYIGLGSGLSATSNLQNISSYITLGSGESIVDFDMSDYGGVVITNHYVWRYGIDTTSRFANGNAQIYTWAKLSSQLYDGEITLTSVDLDYGTLLVGTGADNTYRIIVTGNNNYNQISPTGGNVTTPTYGKY